MPTAVTSVFRSDTLGRLSPRAMRRAMLVLYGQARRLRDRFERHLATLIES